MLERRAELQRFRRDAEYYERHRADLVRRFPDQWVAIFNQDVIAADSDYERVLDQIEEKGVAVGKVFIEQATEKDDLLILTL